MAHPNSLHLADMTNSLKLVFRVTLFAGVAIAGALATLALLRLSETEDPAAVVGAFDALQAPLTWFVPLIYLVLSLLAARTYSRKETSALPLFFAWLYFAMFTAIDYMWMSSRVFQYTKDTDTWQGGFSVAPLLGGMLIGFSVAVSLGLLLSARNKRKDFHPPAANQA